MCCFLSHVIQRCTLLTIDEKHEENTREEKKSETNEIAFDDTLDTPQGHSLPTNLSLPVVTDFANSPSVKHNILQYYYFC